MANQKVSNERKRELEQMDPFQEKLLKGLAFARQYRKQLMIIGASLLVMIIIFSSVIYSFKAAETRASFLVTLAEKKYAGETDPVKGYAAVKSDFNAIFEEYANTTAGKAARVKFANICFTASDYDTALIHFKAALDAFDSDPAMKNILLSSLGHTRIAQGKNGEAETYFKQILDSQSGILKDEARFTLALLSEKNNADDSSRAFLQEIVDEHPDSIYLSIAQNKLNASK